MAELRRAKRHQGRGRRTLLAAALTAAVVAGSAGWAAGSEQQAVTGPVPGVSSWRAERGLGRPLPDPATASPTRIARFFAGLTERQRQTLAERHALVVGNLDGAPPELRYAANSRALREERAKQLARAADPQLPGQDRAAARARAERYAELRAPGRQILAFDPRGRGQVAEVYGDLAAAGHVSVIVPGSDIDLDTFDRTKDRLGTPAGMAQSLHAATGHRTAVIAWAGYTTPVGLGPDAATGRLAEAGAPRLARLAQGVVAAGGPRPVLFCHSYGSVVCGLAAPETPASDVVVAGSPGMRVDRAADLGTRARIWAAKDPGDWIDNVPHVQLLGLGHGADPADPAFGARRVPAADADGHTGYFAPGTDSLHAFAEIALGKTCCHRKDAS
ncbi:alpha/beta hydrolase [Streptomyces sp. B-S-A8]|uniref:Alpha/beta hydrolase n=1 Tax=Streptomyces solicavernae TaxID=3043614 RepID=A0ABT6RZF6_9ACTN|nr:alpha/beta hydrolase [Streptomyces sp. B-S-A8]MDI3389715.1 alpha/beta hydrolase [Streptomyces sp. B-S-A8]